MLSLLFSAKGKNISPQPHDEHGRHGGEPAQRLHGEHGLAARAPALQGREEGRLREGGHEGGALLRDAHQVRGLPDLLGLPHAQSGQTGTLFNGFSDDKFTHI